MNIKSVSLLAALAVSGLTAKAAVLVDSTFTDSTLGATGRNTANSSNLTPWFLVSSTTAGNATVVNDSGNLGKSMQVNSGNTIYTAFSTSTLLTGETITLTLSYRFPSTPSASSETFRIGLYDSNTAAAVTADISPIASADLQQYDGYYAGLAVGVNPSASGTALRQRNTGNSNALTSTSGLTAISSNNSGVASGTTIHTLEYSITRTSATELSFVTKIDGTTLLTGTDSTGIYTTFNSLAIAGVGGTIILDNILLETVPEPGTALLLALGGAFVLYRTRRRFARL